MPKLDAAVMAGRVARRASRRLPFGTRVQVAPHPKLKPEWRNVTGTLINGWQAIKDGGEPRELVEAAGPFYWQPLDDQTPNPDAAHMAALDEWVRLLGPARPEVFVDSSIPIGTRVKVRPRTGPWCWGKGACKATMLANGVALRDGSGHFEPTIRLPSERWIIMRDQTPNPVHVEAVLQAMQPRHRNISTLNSCIK